MIKTVTRILAATAALGLVVAPIMAQANTRAADSAPAYSTSNALPGLGRAAGGEGQSEGGIGGGSLLIGGVAVAVIVNGIVVASDSGDNGCASPGAC